MRQRMRVVCSLLLAVCLGMGCLGPKATASFAPQPETAAQSGPSFVRGRVLVQFHPETTAARRRRLIAQAGVSDVGEVPGVGVHILELPTGADEEVFVHAFKA